MSAHTGSSASESAARDLLVRMYRAFNTRDVESVLAMLHPDVDWPNGWEGGRMQGRARVREYWTRQWGEIDPHVDPIAFATDGAGRTRVTVHQVVRDEQGEVVADDTVVHVYEIRDGLVVRMDIETPPSP